MFHIGFSGTKEGMTEQQFLKVDLIFNAFIDQLQTSKRITFHHGDCIGADFNAHTIADFNLCNIIIHPPVNPKYRAYADQHFPICVLEVKRQYEYLTRNHHIVNACNIMIITPKEDKERLRSGTWSTYRYAKKKNKKIILVLPSGKISP